MTSHVADTEYLARDGGTIAFDRVGEGPLVVLSPGLADTRRSYRFLAPILAAEGYQVATVDLRGHGESSTGWSSYRRTDTAEDLLAVVRHIGEPAVILGQSFSGGAATIAAATAPDLVRGIVEIAPFTRPPSFSASAFLRNDHGYRRGVLLLGRFALSGSIKTWSRYLDVAYPSSKPADWDEWLAQLQANLAEPGRIAAARKMLASKPVDAAEHLSGVRSPALVIMGSADSDFADPEGEAREIVDLLPDGLATYALIDGAGHYPHAERADEVAAVMLPFLARVTGA